MLLNPNKNKALLVSISRTVNPPHCDLVLSGVSICASNKIDILGVKFESRLTFEDHERGIISLCLSRNWYFEIGEACLCGHFCVASLILCICCTNF